VSLLINAGLFSDWIELQKIFQSDGITNDQFGRSVSISEDYAVIGMPYDNDIESNSGSAYIFHRNGTTWTEQAKIIPSDGADGDNFGRSVSISGDYAIIGARYDDVNESNAGSAYIFIRDGTTWSEQVKITASDGARNDFFGWSVSISGDYAVIGARMDDDNGSNSGSAYIFHRTGTTWYEQAKLIASDGQDSADFGNSVSISGDYVLIAAQWDDDYIGSAYIFFRNGITWTEQAKLTSSDREGGDWFGYSVSVSGNYALIGAYADDDNGSASGSAYIFHRIGTTWIEHAKLTASDGVLFDFFGWSVSISGYHAVIGVPWENDFTGSAYFYYEDNPPTPVELSAFTATYSNDSSFLNWTTQSESNNQGWNIYRSETELENAFQINAALINGAGTTTEPTEYEFVDEHVFVVNTTYWYWLESITFSGVSETYGPISLTIETPEIEELPETTVLYSAFPNPFKPETTIKFSIKENETAVFTIYNFKGQKIISENFEAGTHEYKWNADKYASGIYLYKLRTESYSKINKMLMLK